MALVISLLVTICALFVAVAVRAQRHQKQVALSSALMNRSGNPTLALRDFEMTQPWTERLLKPAMRRLTNFGRILTPSRNLEQLQRDLIHAGLQEKLTVSDFLGLRFLVGAGLASIVILFYTLTGQSLFSGFGLILALFMVGLYAPNMWLRSQVRKRKKAIALALPDALDMMSICVDAGLGFEAAIQKVAYQWNNELALEFRRAISEMRVGLPRSEALRNMAERTDVAEIASFIAVLVQAERLGVAIRRVLHTQADQLRIRRRQRAQEAAQKAPIKMLFPLALFVFPATFLIILGPAIPRIMSAFK